MGPGTSGVRVITHRPLREPAASKQVRNSTARAPQRSYSTPAVPLRREPGGALRREWGPGGADCSSCHLHSATACPPSGPTNSYMGALTPSLSESDLMWKQGL